VAVTRAYLPDPPKEFSIQLFGHPSKDEITQKNVASSSSPRLDSYTVEINDHQDQASIWHNRPSHERLMDSRMAIEQIQKKLREGEEKVKERKEKEEKMLEWEVSSRIAQAINDAFISKWKEGGDADLVQRLKKNKIHFLPNTMTAEAIKWRTKHPYDNNVFNIERFYTSQEQQAYLTTADQNKGLQADIDSAWLLLERNKVDLNLMLTSWAKRHRDRNTMLHMVPSVAFAERYISGDIDFFGKVEARAKYHIQTGQTSRGDRLFEV